jgi:hypothetical protein
LGTTTKPGFPCVMNLPAVKFGVHGLKALIQ